MLAEPHPTAATAATTAEAAASTRVTAISPAETVSAVSGTPAAPSALAASGASASSPVAVADPCGALTKATAPENVSPSCAVSSDTPHPATPASAAAPTDADAAGGTTASSTVRGFARKGSSLSGCPSAAGREPAAGAPVSTQGGERQKTVAWDLDVENALLDACITSLNYTACRDLERRVRSGSGTEDRARQTPCCPTPDAANVADPARAAAASSAGHSHAHGGSCCNEKKCRSNGCSADSATTTCTHDRKHACASSVPYKFKKDPDDHLGELLDSWVAPSRLRDLLGRIAERAAKVFNNVIDRGKADGMDPPTGPEERQLRLEILKEATIREVQLRVVEEVHEERKRDSREGGMFANPLAFKQGHLSHLLPDTVAALMKEGVAVQHAFVGEKVRKMILNEIELLEYDGRFNEVFQQSLNPVRKDYMCWVTLSDLDREKQQGLWQLFQSMQALPYELNKKAHLCLQVSWVFQLAVYPGDGAYYRRHMDAGFSPALDNGRKITALYYPNPPDWKPSDGGYLRVYERWRRKEQLGMAPGSVAPYEVATNFLREIEPAGDTLVLLRSREMPHEVLETHRKRFAITLWMSGPPGPGDDI